MHYLYLKTLFAQNPTSPYLHFPPTRSEQVDRFYVWLEEDVTYLFISYSLVCGKVLLKIYGMGHKIAELKEKIKLRKCPAYLQKGEILIFNH